MDKKVIINTRLHALYAAALTHFKQICLGMEPTLDLDFVIETLNNDPLVEKFADTLLIATITIIKGGGP